MQICGVEIIVVFICRFQSLFIRQILLNIDQIEQVRFKYLSHLTLISMLREIEQAKQQPSHANSGIDFLKLVFIFSRFAQFFLPEKKKRT